MLQWSANLRCPLLRPEVGAACRAAHGPARHAGPTSSLVAGHCFEIGEVRRREFKLDGFKWLKEDSVEDADDLPEPEELATDADAELEWAVKELNVVLALLENAGKR